MIDIETETKMAVAMTAKQKPGWVVTWFLFGYTARMFEYTVLTF